MDNLRRKIIKTLSVFTVINTLGIPVVAEARYRKKNRKVIKFWENESEKEQAQSKLISVFQRPYNELLLVEYINYITLNEKNLYKDKRNVSYMLFFNIHIFSVETRKMIKNLLRLFYFENQKDIRKKEIEQKILEKNKKENINNKAEANNEANKTIQFNQSKKTTETNENNESNKTDNSSIEQINFEKIKQENISAKKQKKILEEIEKIDIVSAIIFYGGYSYLTLNNLYLYKELESLEKVLEKIKKTQHHWSYQEIYLKNIWGLFVYVSLKKKKNKNINTNLINTSIKFIEKFIFKKPFFQQKKKFKDKKFNKIWKRLFKKKTYRQYSANHYEFAYLLSLLSFYYSLLGYENYSVLFLNKIKEKFLINKDIKTIMFYFYINFLGYFLLNQYMQAIKYFKFILEFDNSPSLKELGFLVYSRAAIDAYDKKNYKIAWEYSNKAVKYGVNLDPVKYLDDVTLMKKVLKTTSEKYIDFLTKGNNYDIINYIKSETLKTLSLTF